MQYLTSFFFSKKKEKIKEDPSTIPVIVKLSPEQLETILTTRKAELEDVISEIIQTKNLTLYRVLKEYSCFNITSPRSDASYRKRVLSLVEAAEKNERRSTELKQEQRSLKGYSVVIDTRENRLCVSIWNGS